jgi:molybdenum cofactor biosynthesis enzyme
MKNKVPLENDVPRHRKRKRMRSLKSLSKKQLNDKKAQAYKNIHADMEWLQRVKNRKSSFGNVFTLTALSGIEKNSDRLDKIIGVIIGED